MTKIWLDFTNTPHVHFLMAIKKTIEQVDMEFMYSARDFSETVKLLEKQVGPTGYTLINNTYGNSKISKALSLYNRFNAIRKEGLEYDLSLSCGSEGAIWHSKLSGKKSIAFGDNDTARQWTYGYLVDYAFFPDAIPSTILEKQGLRKKLYQYHGYKEDIYISYYEPDKNFLSKIPFETYLVVRPENIHANYLNNASAKSIVPQLLENLVRQGFNIVYLPRYESDKVYGTGMKNVFIPDQPLNGLDLCYYSDAVLTGAGTLAREAACMNVPSFSFYAGKQLLAVDYKLITENKIVFSRDPSEIISKLSKISKHSLDISRSIQVREELKVKLLEIIDSWYKFT